MSLNYDRSTQNRTLQQAVITGCFRKKSPLTVYFSILPLLNPRAPVAQRVADELVFRRLQDEGVEFLKISFLPS